MFGLPRLRLPHLAVLYLEGVESDNECDQPGAHPDAYLTGDDLASIASCREGGCLRELALQGVVKWDDSNAPDYSVFSALATLTSLTLSTSTKGVDTLVSLRGLNVCYGQIDDDTLVGIAQHLTRLTVFSVWSCELSERAGESGLLDACVKNEGVGNTFEYDEENCATPVCEQLAGCLRRVPSNRLASCHRTLRMRTGLKFLQGWQVCRLCWVLACGLLPVVVHRGTCHAAWLDKTRLCDSTFWWLCRPWPVEFCQAC